MTTSTLRITQRGRRALTAVVATPVIALSLFLSPLGAVAESTPVDNPFEYVTVLSGDTLWSIASMVDPAGDPRDVVAEIMSLNRLTHATITPGQQIAIPR